MMPCVFNRLHLTSFTFRLLYTWTSKMCTKMYKYIYQLGDVYCANVFSPKDVFMFSDLIHVLMLFVVNVMFQVSLVGQTV